MRHAVLAINLFLVTTVISTVSWVVSTSELALDFIPSAPAKSQDVASNNTAFIEQVNTIGKAMLAPSFSNLPNWWKATKVYPYPDRNLSFFSRLDYGFYFSQLQVVLEKSLSEDDRF